MYQRLDGPVSFSRLQMLDDVLIVTSFVVIFVLLTECEQSQSSVNV
jgi:hypothetical protein